MAQEYDAFQHIRRLSISLLSASGALLFAAFNLIGVGISAGDKPYAADVSAAVIPLTSSALAGFLSLIAVEIAALPSTPDKGHPHSKTNYLQTAFATVSGVGLVFLVYGGFKLISAATIKL